MQGRVHILAVYDPRDGALWQELREQITVLQREHALVLRDPLDIAAGTTQQQQIDGWLARADIVLLLLSASSLASCWSQMEACLRERQRRATLQIIPLQIRPALVPEVLKDLLRLPRSGVAVSKWEPRDEAWVTICEELQPLLRAVPAPTTVPAGLWEIDPPIPSFFGREELLKKLDASLRIAPVQVIRGLGGVGKTQLARAYARRCHSAYQWGFMLPADSEAALGNALVALAPQLGGPGSGDPAAARAAVQRWLASHDGWLLLLDNAAELPGLRGLWPSNPRGHVIITTRHPDGTTFGVPQALDLPPMEPWEATRFLLERIGRGDEEHQMVAELATQLGGLPLALEQAAAYIQAHGDRVADYLEDCCQRRLERYHDRPVLGDYPASVATTWSLNMDQVRRASPAAQALLEICSFLAPDSIPEELFREGAAELGPELSALGESAARPLLLGELLLPLRRYSLLEREPARFRFHMHRLVQDVVRCELPPERQRLWAERVVAALARVFPEVAYTRWPRCERLIAHALRCAEHIRGYEFRSEAAVRLLQRTGCYLMELAQHQGADECYRLAWLVGQESLGQESRVVASVINDLALLEGRRGRNASSRALHQQALQLREQLDAEHPDVAESLLNLGVVAKRLGRLAEAAEHYGRALTLRERLLGSAVPEVATVLTNLGELYLAQRRLAEAEGVLRRALGIREARLPPGDPALARTLNSLAVVQQHLGAFAEAGTLLDRALGIEVTARGERHPAVAGALRNLAVNHLHQRRDSEAGPLLEQALVVAEGTLGPVHPDVAQILLAQALLSRRRGQDAAAAAALQRALAIQEHVLGAEHPALVDTLERLAVVCEGLGQQDEGAAHRKRAATLVSQHR